MDKNTPRHYQPSSGINRRLLGVSFGLSATFLGAYLLYRTLSRYDPAEILASVSSADPARLFASLAFAACSYLCLSSFDWLALRYAGKPLSYRRAAWASFTSLSLGHNIGFAVLSSGAIRYRFYTRWGLGAFEVGKVILFCGVTVALGLVTLGGGALLARPGVGAQILGVDPAISASAGVACLAVPAGYLGAASVGGVQLRFRSRVLEIPPLKLAVQQVVVGTLNFGLVAACLHQALNAVAEASYPAVVTVYVIANTAALASHVPGGLGVIESSVLFLLPGEATIAAVLIFRFIYFLVPLVFGLVSLLLSEMLLTKEKAPSRSS